MSSSKQHFIFNNDWSFDLILSVEYFKAETYIMSLGSDFILLNM